LYFDVGETFDLVDYFECLQPKSVNVNVNAIANVTVNENVNVDECK